MSRDDAPAGNKSATDVDIVVIGMGPGGEEVAGRLARAGLSVVGVEARLVGGECPYYACIPTKMMVRGADVLAEARRVAQFSGWAQAHADWAPVARRISEEATTGWDDRIAVERFESTGGRFVRGTGRITAPGEVTVSTPDGFTTGRSTTDRSTSDSDRVFRARRGIVLNPGTDPAIPPIAGLAGTPFWTNRDAVRQQNAPSSLLVLGGGPVGLEFAQVFARFGTRVTLVEAQSRLLAVAEPEASAAIASVLRSEGVQVHTGTSAQHVDHGTGGFTVTLDSGEAPTAERLLVATGRRTDLARLGVATVGLDETARTIPVDHTMRATDGVWAIGDVTGHGAFTHTSVYQARIAAANILGRDGATANYRAAPAVTFTDPEVASVGLTEAAATARGLTVRTATTPIASSVRGWIHRAGEEGLIKLVADHDAGVLVGATVVAPYGGEILGALAVAVHGQVPVDQLRAMIFAYPTFHRAIEDALDHLDAASPD